MSRPREIDRDGLLERLVTYIDENEVPILAEFAYINKIPRTMLYDMPELSDAIKLCHDKKEAMLEKGALVGAINTSMAIFSLKQLGWKDRQEVQHSGTISDLSKMTREEREEYYNQLKAKANEA